MKVRANLISPWAEYVKKINELFMRDPEVDVAYDNIAQEVKILVSNTDKAVALQRLLPAKRVFGNVTLNITVVPPNTDDETYPKIFERAFAGNPEFRAVRTVSDVFSNPVTYVIFEPNVIQYHNDNIGDIHGNRTTYCQDLAKEVFIDIDGVFYCTERKDGMIW